jgi:hypothetical protein
MNVVEQLPLLVVMIRIFHGFPLAMWGYKPVDIWIEENGAKVSYSRNESPVGQFQIKGRRTFTADATKSPIEVPAATALPSAGARNSRHLNKPATQPSSEGLLFLKSAWPETSRRKEPEVIDEAYKRAKKMLGTEARSVTDHLPVLISSEELVHTSTEIIRHLVKSKKEDGFRVQLWMLSKKLEPIHALKPKDFWTAFWHTLRCKSSFLPPFGSGLIECCRPRPALAYWHRARRCQSR